MEMLILPLIFASTCDLAGSVKLLCSFKNYPSIRASLRSSVSPHRSMAGTPHRGGCSAHDDRSVASRDTLQRLLSLSGGSNPFDSPADANTNTDANAATSRTKNVSILVSVPGPSEFMHRRRSFDINPNDTVASLKQLIEKAFPGQPPFKLQRLFLGTTELRNDDVIGSLSDQSRLTVTLDTLCGTNAYNRTMSISEAIEAMCAIDVHLAANFEAQMEEVLKGINPKANLSDAGLVNASKSRALKYRYLFESLNTSLYTTYNSSISRALEREKEPVVTTPDTAAWIGDGGSVLVKAAPSTAWASIKEMWIQKELGLYSKSVKETAILTLQLVAIAYFVAMTKFSRNLILLVALGNIISHLRIVRLCTKAIVYTALPYISQYSFLIALLSAPYSTIMSEYVGELRREGHFLSPLISAEDGGGSSNVAAKTLRGLLDLLARAKSSVQFQVGEVNPRPLVSRLSRDFTHGHFKQAFSFSKPTFRPTKGGPEALKNRVRETSSPGQTSMARSILKSRFGKSKKNDK